MTSDRKYWFPAKRYGWGWGIPSAWQGWVVLVAFIALVIAGIILFPPAKQVGFFFAYVALMVALLTGVCWVTGEPPRWRWGDDRRE